MALIARNETTRSLGRDVQLANTKVVLQCMNEEFKESQNSGNFHIDRTWEVIDAPMVKYNGQDIDLKGIEVHQYLTTKFSDTKGGYLSSTDPKTKKSMGRVYEDYEKLELADKDLVLDNENPQLLCKGIVADGVINTKGQPLMHPANEEELAKGMKVSDRPQLDANNKPIEIFRPQIAYLLKRNRDVAPMPF